MKKMMVYMLCCVVFLMGCSAAGQDTGIDLSLNNLDGDGVVHGMYEKGYDTIDELMEAAELVVRATPTQVEVESALGICWVMDVAESSQPGLETIRLRQLKDEYLLTMGQEVVLVLGQEGDEGYYHIPGGGCGLFYPDPQTGALRGRLLDSLQELSTDTDAQTLEEAFDLLAEAMTKE